MNHSMNHDTLLQPLFYNQQRLIKKPVMLYRTDQGDKRYYYTITDAGSVESYASVTTILEGTMPTSEYLIKWISDLGYKRAEQLKKEKAEYGTLMHICLSNFLQNGKFDLSTIPSRIEIFKVSNNITYDTKFWAPELEKDMRAFELFASEHDVKPLAISLMLYHPELGFAGEIDCVLDIMIGTGVNGNILKNDVKVDKKTGVVIEDKRRRIIIIMDWKSGKHGFYPNNEAQLHLYKLLWDFHYPHLQIDALYNWSPKNWIETPDYNLKNQMESNESRKIYHYIDLFNIDNKKDTARYYPKYDGILVLGKQNGSFKIETFQEKTLRVHQLKKNSTADQLEVAPMVTRYNSPEDVSSKPADNGNGKAKQPIPEVMTQFADKLGVGFVDCTPEDQELPRPTDFELHQLAQQIQEKPVQISNTHPAHDTIDALMSTLS